MGKQEMRFDDGAAYETGMGSWSRPVGMRFLDWMSPSPGKEWLDVGCGNGAFTDLIARNSAPARLVAADPSPAQLEFAYGRAIPGDPQFLQADAMALPFDDASFDIVVSALVLFFIPDPLKGTQEMARVVRPGGTVAGYVWDLSEGGFPYGRVEGLIKSLGGEPVKPPRAEIGDPKALQELWRECGFEEVETAPITIERQFETKEAYWDGVLATPGLIAAMRQMSEDQQAKLKSAFDKAFDAQPFSIGCRAFAVKGRRPA